MTDFYLSPFVYYLLSQFREFLPLLFIAFGIWGSYHKLESIKDEWEHEEIETRLAPYSEQIQKTLKLWCKDKPFRRFPGGGQLPPKGKIQLIRYIKEYILSHGEIPKGRHEVPSGGDVFGNFAEGFSVDFDLLQQSEAKNV